MRKEGCRQGEDSDSVFAGLFGVLGSPVFCKDFKRFKTLHFFSKISTVIPASKDRVRSEGNTQCLCFRLTIVAIAETQHFVRAADNSKS